MRLWDTRQKRIGAVDAVARGLGTRTLSAINTLSATSTLNNTIVLSNEHDVAARAEEARRWLPRDAFARDIQGFLSNIQDITTLFSDTSGTVPAVINDPIGFIKDISGRGNNLVSPGGTARPTLKQSGGINYLELDGVNDDLTGLFTIAGGTQAAFDRVSCIRQLSWTSDDYIFGGGSAFGGILLQRAVTPNLTMNSGGNGPALGVVLNEDHTISEHFYGASSTIALDNKLFSASGALTGLINPGGLTIGASHLGATFGNFRLYNVMMIDRQLPFREQGFARFAMSPFVLSLPCCFIGDSTMADNGVSEPALTTFFSDIIVTDTSVPGNTIAQQKTAFNAISSGTKATFRAVYLQPGLNNCNPANTTLTALVAEYQDLVTTVRNAVSTQCKIYAGWMVPWNHRWAAIGWEPIGAQTLWLGLNLAITGITQSSSVPAITGIDGRISSHVRLMGDANYALLSDYTVVSDGHPNLWGRRLNALAIRELLVGEGLLRAL